MCAINLFFKHFTYRCLVLILYNIFWNQEVKQEKKDNKWIIFEGPKFIRVIILPWFDKIYVCTLNRSKILICVYWRNSCMDNPYKKGEDIMPPDSLDIRILWKLNRFKFQGIHARLGEVWMKKNVIILICLWNIKHILSTD